MKRLLCLLFLYTSAFAQTATIKIDIHKELGDMKPVWAWFGYDEPNYTYMKDGKKLLSEISALSPVPVYVRAHNLLTSGNGEAALKWGSTNIYTEDADGKPVYYWNIVDSIFDTYVQRGMKPLAQIGFMPEALSTRPQPYRHYWKPGDPYKDIITGWAYPPKDYQKWADLVQAWVTHCVARYGQKEVESWYWELWNEPNGDYWKGTMDEFFKLYDYTVDAFKKALPNGKIGGINVAGTRGEGAQKWLHAFVKHCFEEKNYVTGKVGTPVDAILFHAKGWPHLVNGRVVMDMSPQLRDIETGFKFVASDPRLKDLPIIIGESDPEGCAACGMATNPENAYRNGTMYSSYTAASFAREYLLADQYKVNFKGAVSWSFEFENQPWFYGFRDLATNGVDKPVLNVFRMFGKMKGKRLAVESTRMYDLRHIVDSSVRGATDIGAVAAADKKTAAIMVWNYHDVDSTGDGELVKILVDDIESKRVQISEYRIDNEHSNSYEAWKKMGSPKNPTSVQIDELKKAGQLQKIKDVVIDKQAKSPLETSITLPRQGVSLICLKW